MMAVAKRLRSDLAILVGYPPVLPDSGTCSRLGIDEAAADQGRAIAAGSNTATRAAAGRTGAIFVDMLALGNGHDVCGMQPWVHGKDPQGGSAFHPNHAGARAMAAAVVSAVD